MLMTPSLAILQDPVEPATMQFNLTAAFPAAGSRWGCRVRCMPAVAAAGDPRNTPLLVPSNIKSASVFATAHSERLRITAEMSHAGTKNASLVLTIQQQQQQQQQNLQHLSGKQGRRNRPEEGQGDATSEWARATLNYNNDVDLSQADLSERAIGAWIKSDGCGALLNLQLSAGIGYGQTFREWYTVLTWRGWRYIRFEQQETARRLFNYAWPYNQEAAQRGWDRSRVNTLNVYATNVTTAGCVVQLGVIEALHSMAVPVVAGSTLRVGSTVLKLPALSVGQYIECTDMTLPLASACRTFDANGEEIDLETGGTEGAGAASASGSAAVTGEQQPSRQVPVVMKLLPPHPARTSIIITEGSAELIGPFQLGPP